MFYQIIINILNVHKPHANLHLCKRNKESVSKSKNTYVHDGNKM